MLSAAVMAHPKRADMVTELQAALDRPVKVVWDELSVIVHERLGTVVSMLVCPAVIGWPYLAKMVATLAALSPCSAVRNDW